MAGAERLAVDSGAEADERFTQKSRFFILNCLFKPKVCTLGETDM